MKQILNKFLKSKLFWILVVILSPIIIIYLYFYFDYGYYQFKIQKEYDLRNPNGNRGTCISIIKTRSFPYTTFYYGTEYSGLSKEDMDGYSFFNRKGNEMLHELAKLGIYSETPKGEDKGYPIYEYDLTELGQQYTEENYYQGYHSLCFGRIVIDGVTEIDKEDSRFVLVSLKYHLENVPDWIKDPKIYEQFGFEKKHLEGGTMEATHLYRNTRNGLKTYVSRNSAIRL